MGQEGVEVGIGDHHDVFVRTAERRRVGQLDGVARQIGGEGEQIEVADVLFDDAFGDDLPPALMTDVVGQLLVAGLAHGDHAGCALGQRERLIDAGALGAGEEFARDQRHGADGVVFELLVHVLDGSRDLGDVADHVGKGYLPGVKGIFGLDGVAVRLDRSQAGVGQGFTELLILVANPDFFAGVGDGALVCVHQTARQGLGQSRQVGFAQHLAEIPRGDGAVASQHPDAAGELAVFAGILGRPVLRSRVLFFGHLDPEVCIPAQLVRSRRLGRQLGDGVLDGFHQVGGDGFRDVQHQV